jgi:hypothetical protein
VENLAREGIDRETHQARGDAPDVGPSTLVCKQLAGSLATVNSLAVLNPDHGSVIDASRRTVRMVICSSQLGVVHRRLMRRDARGDVLQLRLGYADIGLAACKERARLLRPARADASAESA